MLPQTVTRWVLGLLLFLSSWAEAAPTLTIFCKTQMDPHYAKLGALPSDVSENYYTPTLNFTDEKNQAFRTLFDYQPYSGDDLKVQLLIRAETMDGTVNIYRSLAHIGRRSATSQVVAPSRKLDPEIETNLGQRGLGKNLMAQKENIFVFAGAASDEFAIYDLTSQRTRTLQLQLGLANPRFSITGNFLIFDLFDKKSYRWQQIAYELNSFKISFQTPRSTVDAFSLEFNPARQNWVWLEQLPKTTSGTLVEMTGNHKSVITKMNSALSLPLIYSSEAGALKVFWTEHTSNRGSFENGKAQEWLLGMGFSQSNSWPFSAALAQALKPSIPTNLMAGGFKAPHSNEIFFSLDRLGGLVSLDTKLGTWRFVARPYLCLSPHWTIQGLTK